MTTLTIGEVAKLAGCRTSALRYYESVGLLPTPSRINGQRRYTPEILQRITIVQFGQQAGFSIAELRGLMVGFGESTPPSQRWRGLAERKLEELEALVVTVRGMQRLLREGLRCNCLCWEDCEVLARRTNPRPACSRGPTRRRARQSRETARARLGFQGQAFQRPVVSGRALTRHT